MNNGITRVLVEGICNCLVKVIYDENGYFTADIVNITTMTKQLSFSDETYALMSLIGNL